MLRDVVVHLANDQPLLADLFALPRPSDASLVCTNLRSLSGKTPSFVARSDATFLFPLQHIRFVEVPLTSIEDADDEAAGEDDETAVDTDGDAVGNTDGGSVYEGGRDLVVVAAPERHRTGAARRSQAGSQDGDNLAGDGGERRETAGSEEPDQPDDVDDRADGTDDDAYAEELLRRIRAL